MKQTQALRAMLGGDSVFLTGAPGSGKTYVLNQFIARAKKVKKRIAITASTGIAATHIGGTTIHSWAGLGIRDSITEQDHKWLKENARLLKRYNNLDTLIIDEVSMLHGKRLDMIDQICRLLRVSDKPFGGLQIVLTGDLFQLPPIDRDATRIDFAHLSKAWRDLNPKICYLTEQHRQLKDPLLDLLEAMRANDINQAHFDALGERLGVVVPSNDTVTRLYSHNQDVEQINSDHLSHIQSESKTFVMETYGVQAKVEQLSKSVLAPEMLELKAGAEVMFVANNFTEGYVNGSRGTVVEFKDGQPVVRIHSTGRKVTVEKNSWALEEDGREKARVTQYPLRLAWAITIHKSQGMSLDSAEIDLSRAFTPGMGYVALSRVRSLEGIYLKGINNTALAMHPDIFVFDNELRNASDELSQSISSDAIGDEHIAATNLDQSLLEVLKTWRAQEGEARSIPHYMVANNKTLDNLATDQPTSTEKLKIVSGVGPKMIERYGGELVALIVEHLGAVPVESQATSQIETGDEQNQSSVSSFLAAKGVSLSHSEIEQLKNLL